MIELESLHFAESGHDEPWRDDVAKELNILIAGAIYALANSYSNNEVIAQRVATATLSICKRVAEFDEIRMLHEERV